jgi:hypothetical protein
MLLSADSGCLRHLLHAPPAYVVRSGSIVNKVAAVPSGPKLARLHT